MEAWLIGRFCVLILQVVLVSVYIPVKRQDSMLSSKVYVAKNTGILFCHRNVQNLMYFQLKGAIKVSAVFELFENLLF